MRHKDKSKAKQSPKDPKKQDQTPLDESVSTDEAQAAAATEATADEQSKPNDAADQTPNTNDAAVSESAAPAEAGKSAEKADESGVEGDKPADEALAAKAEDAESAESQDKSEEAGDDKAGPTEAADGGDADSAEAAPVEAEPEPKKAGRAAMVIAVIALLLALTGLGGGYYLYMLSQKQEQSLTSSLANSDSAWRAESNRLADEIASAKSSASAAATAAGQARDALQAQLGDQQSQLGDLDANLTGVTESLAQTQEYALRSQRGWLLAEVEYLFRIAMQRVLLAGDLDSAAAALRAADARLHELGDVNYLPVRQRLADEIAALRGVDRPDVEGTVFELVRLGRRADKLPLLGVLAKAEEAVEAKPEAIDVMPEGAFWDAVQQFIVVRRNDVKVDLSVSPSKDQMSRAETLRLQLQAAQLAAMRRDEMGYHNYMAQAATYANKEYETGDPKVQRFIEDLVALGERNIVPHIDTLGETLQLLKDTNARYAEPSPIDQIIEASTPDAEEAAAMEAPGTEPSAMEEAVAEETIAEEAVAEEETVQ